MPVPGVYLYCIDRKKEKVLFSNMMFLAAVYANPRYWIWPEKGQLVEALHGKR